MNNVIQHLVNLHTGAADIGNNIKSVIAILKTDNQCGICSNLYLSISSRLYAISTKITNFVSTMEHKNIITITLTSFTTSQAVQTCTAPKLNVNSNAKM